MTLSSSTLDVKARPTEVLSAGTGEPLVFLHGGGIIEGFDFLNRLADRFRVIAPLMPGYGATELDPPLTSRDQVAQHTRDVLDELGIERTVLVGHSLGGWLAATFAAHFPERVVELVLGAPFGMNVPEHPMANMMALSPSERLATLTNNPDIFNGRFPSGPDPAFEAARAREGQAIMRFMPGPHDPEMLGVLSLITTPTQLLWGEDDRLIPIAHAREWQKAIPHASLRVLPATGHLLFHERPESLTSIVEFVDSCRGERARATTA